MRLAILLDYEIMFIIGYSFRISCTLFFNIRWGTRISRFDEVHAPHVPQFLGFHMADIYTEFQIDSSKDIGALQNCYGHRFPAVVAGGSTFDSRNTSQCRLGSEISTFLSNVGFRKRQARTELSIALIYGDPEAVSSLSIYP